MLGEITMADDFDRTLDDLFHRSAAADRP